MVVTRPCAVRDVSRNLFLLLSGEECCVVDPFMFWQCLMSRDFMTKSRDMQGDAGAGRVFVGLLVPGSGGGSMCL